MLILGLIATVADCSEDIENFIRYHIAIGFTKLYLFVDDNDLLTLKNAKKYEQVTVFNPSQVKEHYENILTFPKFINKRDLVDKEVMVRQELNFWIANSIAKKDGVDWILHIDIDELFFPNGHDLQTHFKSLQINNFRSATYLNYESISTHVDSPSIYLSSEYFKINYFKNLHWFFNDKQKQLISSTSWLREKYFNFYQNGKSAVSTYGNKIVFQDVHSIIGNGPRKMGTRSDPLILHFPCARFSDFVKKYSRLGDFPDNWQGARRAGKFINEIHLQSRNFFKENKDDKDALLTFFTENFVLEERNISELVELNLAKKIDFHIKILEDLNKFPCASP